jgi:hypothetical protein
VDRLQHIRILASTDVGTCLGKGTPVAVPPISTNQQVKKYCPKNLKSFTLTPHHVLVKNQRKSLFSEQIFHVLLRKSYDNLDWYFVLEYYEYRNKFRDRLQIFGSTAVGTCLGKGTPVAVPPKAGSSRSARSCARLSRSSAEAGQVNFIIRIRMIRMLLGLPNPDPDPLVRGTDPAPDPSLFS